ncbi:MAG TPA: hypothetical protein VGJ02_11150 [Pyrinomonadaceae bacterium]
MKNYPLIVVAVILVLALNGFASKSKTTNPGAIVQFGACAQGDAACQAANRVRSDGGGAYVNGSQGVSAVFNLVSGSRDLTFWTTGSTRSLIFDFTDPAYTGGAPSWWYASPVQSVKAQMNVLGAYYAKETCVTDPNTGICTGNFETRINAGNWTVGGSNKTNYALLWNPTAMSSRPVNSPYSTSPVNVNYVRDASGERFSITPLPSSDCGAGSACESDPIIAGLEVTSGRSVSGGGQYHMPFTMTVIPQ